MSFSLWMSALFLALPAFAGGPLTEAQIYVRCHSQFARRHPNPADPWLVAVREGKMKAADACMELVRLGELGANGKLKSKDERAADILKTFQSFHMTWFPTKDFVRQETETPTSMIYDANEMGYHLTSSLFSPGGKFADVVTRPVSLRSIRESKVANKYFLEANASNQIEKLNAKKWQLGHTGAKDEGTWTPLLIPVGKLVGIEPMPARKNQVRWLTNEKDPSQKDYETVRFDATDSLGGGILGTPSFILLNTTLTQGTPSDGGRKMHRAWSVAVFSSLMCRSVPLLRESDVRDHVQPESPIPFRKKAACMRCHTSMDPMAAVIRNTTDVRLGDTDDTAFSPRALAVFPTREPVELPAKERAPQDYLFHHRPPNGRLTFRDYRGELVDQAVDGPTGLGKAMANTDDLYLCAAKRYFEFMTGIDVELGDFSQPPLSEPDPDSQRYRKFVIEQGQALRRTQSLEELVRNILKSDFYAASDYKGKHD